jgi:hypothetical protein
MNRERVQIGIGVASRAGARTRIEALLWPYRAF